MTLSIHNQIVENIFSKKKRKLIFPEDFKNLGSSEAIRKSLSRLEKNGVLKRLSKGIYIIAQEDPVLGILYPSMDELAKGIARRDKARIIPTGTYALNRLGLSTQVPMNVTYLTDGASRKIKVGKRTIIFKTTTPKKLAMKGKISSLVIQAFRELGQGNINKEIQRDVKKLLSKEAKQNVQEDAKLAPAWISKLLLNYINAPK